MNTFSIQFNVGKAKHVVTFYNGVSKHADGSPFSDMRIFKSIKARDEFIKILTHKGYRK